MMIRLDQFDDLGNTSRKKFLLEVVCDWHALFDRVFGRPAKISFERTWEIAMELATRIESLPQHPVEDPTYELIHRILLAIEQDVDPKRIEVALDQFCLALPAYEAGFALLGSSLMVNDTSTAE